MANITEVNITVRNFSETKTAEADDYDDAGALQYVICVITVYAFVGVFCLVLDRFRLRSPKRWHTEAKLQGDAIRKYLKAEKSLKLEGHKMKMLTEIEKHFESVQRFEEKNRLFDIENDIKMEDFGLNLKAKRKIQRKLKKERRKMIASLDEIGLKDCYSRKLSQTYVGENINIPDSRRFSASAVSRATKSKKGEKRKANTMDAFGKMGFSFLFMNTNNALSEETEQYDTESSSGDDTERAKLTMRSQTDRKASIGGLISRSDDSVEPFKETSVIQPNKYSERTAKSNELISENSEAGKNLQTSTKIMVETMDTECSAVQSRADDCRIEVEFSEKETRSGHRGHKTENILQEDDITPEYNRTEVTDRNFEHIFELDEIPFVDQ